MKINNLQQGTGYINYMFIFMGHKLSVKGQTDHAIKEKDKR